MDKVKIKIDGLKDELSLKEAREIYNELHKLFGPVLKKNDDNQKKKFPDFPLKPSLPYPRHPVTLPKDFGWPDVVPKWPNHPPPPPPYYKPLTDPYTIPPTICKTGE